MQEILNHGFHALSHTFEHTWYMLFVLFGVYLIIELIEHKAMDRAKAILSNKYYGIAAASALGLFPQCGFSVAAANLYAERLISAGTVAAVFVATSDEALPILLANPSAVKWFLPVLLIKLVWAIVVGFIVNAIFKLTRLDIRKPRHTHLHAHGEHRHEGGEHHHCEHCDSEEGIFKAAIKRTVSVFIFIFVTSLVLHFVIELVGEDRLCTVLMTNSLAQPFLAALIGLIPNCAASIVTTELFVSGALGLGSLVAALSAGAGIGMLVLFRVNRNYKQNIILLSILYITSALLGVIIELIV